MNTERNRNTPSPENIRLSNALKTVALALIPEQTEIEQQKLIEIAEKANFLLTEHAFQKSFVKDWGHSNYLASIYIPITKYWTIGEIKTKGILFRSFINYRDSDGYEQDIATMWAEIRQQFEVERVVKKLPEPVVLLPRPSWITDSKENFYCLASEAKELKKEFIENLKR